MISISPWFERSFQFNLDPRYFPLVLERLMGTRARVDDLLGDVPAEILRTRPGGAWSIQEHVGHLVDLEPLWYGRVDDILSDLAKMRSADLQNRATDAANHNDRDLGDIVADFSTNRDRLTGRLSSLGIDEIAKAALHPRLEEPMRIIDLGVFVAEHDDHHLATIRQRLAAERR